MDNERFAGITRSMIEHENILLNHRMTWMWTLQGLLIAAVVFAWDQDTVLLWLICIFGVLSSASFGLSFISSVIAINNLLSLWHKYADKNQGYEGPTVIGSPANQKIPTAFKPWGLLPWLSVVFWIAIVTIKVYEQ